MRFSVRYEEKIQTIELNDEETEQMWVSLSLVGEGLSKSNKERLIQDAFNDKYNKPEYNNWHKFDRHRGMPKKPFRNVFVNMKLSQSDHIKSEPLYRVVLPIME